MEALSQVVSALGIGAGGGFVLVVLYLVLAFLKNKGRDISALPTAPSTDVVNAAIIQIARQTEAQTRILEGQTRLLEQCVRANEDNGRILTRVETKLDLRATANRRTLA